MGQCFGISIESACVFACLSVVFCGGRFVAGQLIMVGDLTCEQGTDKGCPYHVPNHVCRDTSCGCPAFTMPSHATDQDFSHTPVQEPTASKAGLFVHERT